VYRHLADSIVEEVLDLDLYHRVKPRKNELRNRSRNPLVFFQSLTKDSPGGGAADRVSRTAFAPG